jgi:hypothetical protein
MVRARHFLVAAASSRSSLCAQVARATMIGFGEPESFVAAVYCVQHAMDQ